MIKKINQITNVGKFESFSSTVDFTKNNIIFGFNGAGKSTLSDIFYSLAHNDRESLITRRVTLKRNENEPAKQINIVLSDENGNNYVFDNTHWTNVPNNIFVFNNQYVREHVFVSKELKGDTVPIGMGSEGVKYMSQRERVKKDIDQLMTEMNNNIIILSSAGFKFKDVTSSKITQRVNIKRYDTISQFELYPPSSEKIIREKIKAQTKYSKELDDMQKCHELYSTISGLTLIDKAVITKTIRKTPRITSKEIARYLSNTLTTADISWAVKGYKSQKDQAICPLCGQTITDQKAKDFFNKLGKYVNQHLDENVQVFCTILKNYAGQLNSMDIQRKINIFNEIIQLLDSIKLLRKKDTSRLQKGLSWNESYTSLLKNIIDKIYNKADNPYANIAFTDEEKNCLTLLNSVIKNISVLGEIIDGCQNRLEIKIENTLSIDEMSMRCDLSFGSLRSYMENLKSQAYHMKQLNHKLEKLNKEIDDCYNQIQLETVNTFLNKLNTNIKIEVSNKKYFIRLKNFLPMEYSKGEDSTIFSEGEQKAIAFAYFLSEIKENDIENDNRVIVIDDPINSMDLCRKSIISYQLAEFMKKDNTQLFILSHDITFIERITNFVPSNIEYETFELNIDKNNFLPLQINDYLTTDAKVYFELISASQNDHSELAKILALISLRPYAYVNKVPENILDAILKRSTYFSHTLYSHNKNLKYKQSDYTAAKLKEYINLINSVTNNSFDAEEIIEDYQFKGFDFNTLINIYHQIPLTNIHDARKKVLLMRPLIEACFFQMSERQKFNPENIGQMYKKTMLTNKSNLFKLNICKELYELYDSSKKYHHGAEDGSFLGISWINPSEVEFYNSTLESIIQRIQSLGSIRSISA